MLTSTWVGVGIGTIHGHRGACGILGSILALHGVGTILGIILIHIILAITQAITLDTILDIILLTTLPITHLTMVPTITITTMIAVATTQPIAETIMVEAANLQKTVQKPITNAPTTTATHLLATEVTTAELPATAILVAVAVIVNTTAKAVLPSIKAMLLPTNLLTQEAITEVVRTPIEATTDRRLTAVAATLTPVETEA